MLPAYARRMHQVNAALRQVYLCGGNSRRIRGALRPLLQSRALSRSAIRRLVQGLKAQVADWQTRSLAELDLVYLYLDGFHLRVRLGGRVSPVPVLSVLGVQRNGQKVLVHLSLCGSESTMAWAAVCEDLAARGVRRPQLCLIDGGKGLRAAVAQTWPQAALQRCTVHKLRNLLTTAPKRLHDELRVDYHAIVMAEDGATARRASTAFGRKWTKTCAGAVKSLEEAGAELLTMYRDPRSQWKSLRSVSRWRRAGCALPLLLTPSAPRSSLLSRLDTGRSLALHRTTLSSAIPRRFNPAHKGDSNGRMDGIPQWPVPSRERGSGVDLRPRTHVRRRSVRRDADLRPTALSAAGTPRATLSIASVYQNSHRHGHRRNGGDQPTNRRAE